jgi:transposase-like protein
MMTLKDLMATFPNEDACKRFLMERRWPTGVVSCPRCGNEKVYALPSRPWHWACKECGPNKRQPYRFSITAGTILENTKYPVKTWFEVLWQMLNSKKGVSALQIQRQIGSGAYKTAWYMCHRLRAAMHDPDFQKLMGIVELDETYIGGSDRNRHWDKKVGKRGMGSGKIPVIGAIARKDNVVCQMIDDAGFDTYDRFVREAISDKVTLVATDESPSYRHFGKFLPHETVLHSGHEYVRGEVHTQSIEGFWSLLKRGIIGTYHNVSKKYLPLYLAEFQFRYNNRKNPDIFGEAIRGC